VNRKTIILEISLDLIGAVWNIYDACACLHWKTPQQSQHAIMLPRRKTRRTPITNYHATLNNDYK